MFLVLLDLLETFEQRVIVFYVGVPISNSLDSRVTIGFQLIQHLQYRGGIFASSLLKLFDGTDVYRMLRIIRTVICVLRGNVI